MGEIITFYSCEKSIERIKIIVNTATLLCKWGYKVLLLDWDFDAPEALKMHLQHYLDFEEISKGKGLLDLLYYVFHASGQAPASVRWRDVYLEIRLPDSRNFLHAIPAGKRHDNFLRTFINLDVTRFYSEKGGGMFIEKRLKKEWKQAYDYILINSGANISDLGRGISISQMPDMLVLFFATEQGLADIGEVARKAHLERRSLPIDPFPLLEIPIYVEFDDKADKELLQNWLQPYSSILSEMYDWLPRAIQRPDFLEATKISDLPEKLESTCETLAALLADKLQQTAQLIEDKRGFIKKANRNIQVKPESVTMFENPFHYGGPVPHTDFIGRRKELRRVQGRLLKGESTAIIGDPHIGKTSLLNYLASPGKYAELYENKANRWYFSLLDIQMLGEQFTSTQFWEHALVPIKEQIEEESAGSELLKHYTICVENSFGNFTLERLFSQLKKTDQRFILLIDEFDFLLHNPVLNKAEFYGGLRSLSSRSAGAFTLIIASRTPLSQLNASTQEFNPTGSPFFNIFSEVTLGPLAENSVKQLLSLAEDRFTTSDKQIIQTLAGHHPYLLQAASATLWDAYEVEELSHSDDTRRYVAKQLYRELDHFFSDTWNVWSPEMRKAFTAVAIAHQARLLPETTFCQPALLEEFHHWGPELGDLEERGLIVKDSGFETGYQVSSGILLTWLADELIKVVRSDKPFDTWLQDEKIDGAFFSTREKNAFKDAVTGAAKALGQGATAMIEALGKGLGSGVAGKVT